MKILFVHQNFPGQFLHVAPALARRGHDVLALTVDTNARRFEGRSARYKYTGKDIKAETFGLATRFAEASKRGADAAVTAAQLKRAGYEPDIIFSHIGWGEGLFLKEVWPRAKKIVYAEFFYAPHGRDTNFDPELQKASLSGSIWVKARTSAMALDLSDADYAVAPTHWQASTIPGQYGSRLKVIHEGVRTDLIKPDDQAAFEIPEKNLTLKSGDEVLTFVSRNLEPYRGYHTVMRSLPKILRERKNAQVVLVGGDGLSYGTPAPGGKSWKETILDEVKNQIDMDRVHFVGFIEHARFVSLLQISRAHAYLSYPFVLSWSMIEAMSAGALVVGSNTPPVAEVIKHGENGLLVDFFDVEGWSNTMIDALARPEHYAGLRAAARETAIKRYDLNSVCLPQMISFLESV